MAAVDPSPPFVAALHARLPGADVRRGTAEELPHPDDAFDATLAQLVVHFMTRPGRRPPGDGPGHRRRAGSSPPACGTTPVAAAR